MLKFGYAEEVAIMHQLLAMSKHGRPAIRDLQTGASISYLLIRHMYICRCEAFCSWGREAQFDDFLDVIYDTYVNIRQYLLMNTKKPIDQHFLHPATMPCPL